MKKVYLLFSTFVCALAVNAQVSSLNEGFEGGIPASWTIVDNSDPEDPLVQGWFTDSGGNVFDAHSGDVYAASSYQILTSGGLGTISSWLITPELNLNEGAVLKFWTRTNAGSVEYPDRLEVRLSTNGASTDVGTSDTSTGDFTTLLVSVNPTLDTGVYPKVWTEYTATISGITAGATGRIAFRYFVTDAGSSSTSFNSDYIGLDDVTYDAALPVTFMNFNGTIKDNKVLLNWATSNEINNSGYDVERSINGKDFSAIGFVKGNGNTSVVSNYSYLDGSKLPSGTLYYRLKQIDLDGAYKYSNIIQVNFENFSFNVYPNPVVDNSAVQFQLQETANVSIQVTSSTGKIVQVINKGSLQPGTYSVPLSLNNAAKGTYFIKLFANDKSYVQTVIK